MHYEYSRVKTCEQQSVERMKRLENCNRVLETTYLEIEWEKLLQR